jgi:hypothetical protein
MPPQRSTPIAIQMLRHSQAGRRSAASRVLRGRITRLSEVEQLLTIFKQFGDQTCLELIIRATDLVPKCDIGFLLDNTTEEYWRARLIEAIILANDERALLLANKYPRDFIYAAGRARKEFCAKTILRLVKAHAEDVDLVSFSVWSVGQIGKSQYLEQLVQILRRKNPSLLKQTKSSQNSGFPTMDHL